MKRIFSVAFVILVLFCFTACSSKAKFKATVIETNENSITVKPFENEDEIKSSDVIVIHINDKTNLSENKPQNGDNVEITYGGAIAESYPAQIFDCSKIVIIG